jgi:SAM-dependent methyltransferase
MAESSCAGDQKRPVFGERYLTDNERVFEHNAWDHVQWDEDQLQRAEETIRDNSSIKLESDRQDQLKQHASHHWNDFYTQHQNRFFKDRHWLFTEFPELLGNQDDHTPLHILEVGCGAGNTVFPIMQTSKNTFMYCCDFSSTAVELIKTHPLYDPSRCSAFVHDISDIKEPLPIQDNSIDLICLIFVLSAIPQERFPIVIDKLYKTLKPNGKILFRDYGRLDLAQLRFKQGQCLADNHYVRGDGTLVYFFTLSNASHMIVM